MNSERRLDAALRNGALWEARISSYTISETVGDDAKGIERIAKEFVVAGLAELRSSSILPRPQLEPWIRAGRQYAGQIVTQLPEFERLERALEAAFPAKFAPRSSIREFPLNYAFSLLEGCVATISRGSRDYTANASEIDAAVGEMLALLERNSDSVIAVRIVSDVAITPDHLDVGDVTVRALGTWAIRQAQTEIDGLLPGAGREIDDRLEPFPHAPTAAILVARAASEPGDGSYASPGHYVAAHQCLERLRWATMAIRCATASTMQGILDVYGPPGNVRLREPRVVLLDYEPMPMVERIAHLDETTASATDRLARILGEWSSGRNGQPTALGVALDRYERSCSRAPWFDQLVDISVALEAALLDDSNQEISLRLRLRAAQLLSTDADPADRIFRDVKHMYELRSKVVHGRAPKPQKVQDLLSSTSAASMTAFPGVKGAFSVDRFRDLARRAILARGFLSSAGMWPLGKSVDVDGALVNDLTRGEWQTAWRRPLEEMGLPGAAREASPAMDPVLSPTRQGEEDG